MVVETTAQKTSAQNLLFRYLPILVWLPRYKPAWLTADLLAGFTLWGMAVPENIAYTGLAGLPAQAGLYTLLVSLPLYAIFGTSKQLVVSATSASAVVLASTIATLNPPNANMYYTLAETLILLVGVVFLLAGLFKLGFITNFLSRPLMDGFIFGLAIFVAAKQLYKLFGISKGSGAEMLENLAEEFHQDGIQLALRVAHEPVKQMARRSGLMEKIGEDHIFPSLDAAVQTFVGDGKRGEHEMIPEQQ
jgi:MFS superfamily sulfate permease-like transporter